MAEEDGVDLFGLLDLATPWCLHVAATLRIAEHVAAGHGEIGELAAVAGCDRDALHAVLGHLVSKGVFAEFADLARRAGLDVITAASQPSGQFVVECRPAT
jgi:hypothetical protein